MKSPPSRPDKVLGTFTPLKISSRQIALMNALGLYRNLHRAAEAIHTTQPAASLMLKQLEERLEVPLFKRHARGMEATVYGEALIRFARGVTREFDQVQAEIAGLANGAAGLVSVGSVLGAVPGLLASALVSFKQHHPRVGLSVEVDTSDLLLPSLMEGRLDVLLGRLPDHASHPDLHIELLEKGEEMLVIAGPGHRYTGSASLDLKEMGRPTWILHPKGSPMRLRVEGALLQTGVAFPLDIVETASLPLTISMLQSSDMLSIWPKDIALHYARYGMISILPLTLPINMTNLGLLTLRSRPLSAATRSFISHLKSWPVEAPA
ncbi:LysR family transcriptional regulator [Comamonas composti]|uniref:LysR family transcriptional regulator n=1 Tax=Comamonas composti TaxID=408558 RepID=UPI000685198F|nr:LysR family transcriptional regulator [Comamonas composti]